MSILTGSQAGRIARPAGVGPHPDLGAPRDGRSHVAGDGSSPLRFATIPDTLRDTVSRHGPRDADPLRHRQQRPDRHRPHVLHRARPAVHPRWRRDHLHAGGRRAVVALARRRGAGAQHRRRRLPRPCGERRPPGPRLGHAGEHADRRAPLCALPGERASHAVGHAGLRRGRSDADGEGPRRRARHQDRHRYRVPHGGGVRYADPALGLTAEAKARSTASTTSG